VSGRHTLAGGDECHCPDTQIRHTCGKLGGKSNHNYDENAAQAQTAPLPRVNSVDWPPPSAGD
jgi:hypothetical protein